MLTKIFKIVSIKLIYQNSIYSTNKIKNICSIRAKMIEDNKKKRFQYVLVYQLDRFARNRYDSATYKAKLKKNGVRKSLIDTFIYRVVLYDDKMKVLFNLKSGQKNELL